MFIIYFLFNCYFSGLAAGWLLFFKFIIDFFIRHISGLAARWLLFFNLVVVFFHQSSFRWPSCRFYSSNRANPRNLFRDVALRLRFPGLAAGWLLPFCDGDAPIVSGEVYRILQFTGLTAEKGEQFLVLNLATFDYTNCFVNHLTIALKFALTRPKCKSHSSFHMPIVSTVLPKCMGYRCSLFFLVPLTSLVGCHVCFFGDLFLFSASLCFFFSWLVFHFSFQVTYFFSLEKTLAQEGQNVQRIEDIPIEENPNALAKAGSNQRAQRASNHRANQQLKH